MNSSAVPVSGSWRAPARSIAVPRLFAWFLAATCIAAVLIIAAYQARPTYAIGIGDTTKDTALVRGYNAPERQVAADGGRRFRWTRDAGTLVLPGIGPGNYSVEMLLSGSVNPNRDAHIFANGTEIATFSLTTAFQSYHADVPAILMTQGTLELQIVAAPFSPRGDRRTLGVAVQEIIVRPQAHGFVLPPMQIAFALWICVVMVTLALQIAGMRGAFACAGGAIVAMGIAAFLVWDRLFLTVDAGGVVRAAALMLAITTAIRFVWGPLLRRLGLVATPREVCWLAAIAGATLALRFAGMLHPGIVIIDLKFHLHRFAEVADYHTLLLPIQSAEFGGRTVLYAPTPYLFMLPLSWVIHDRTLMLFLFSLGIDAVRFCTLWIVARRVTHDPLTANLAVLVMALMPVGWIVYQWGTYANIFAEGMLTLLFALLVVGYGQLAGPHRWRWCAVFAVVIGLTLLAHIGVFVLTAVTVTLYLLVRIGLVIVPLRSSHPGRERRWTAAAMFTIAGITAAAVAFALFYRFPAHDVLTGTSPSAVEQETAATAAALTPHAYRTGGATPDDRIGLGATTTPRLSVALIREAWETSFAFYRVWPVLAAIAGCLILWRTGRRDGADGTDREGPMCASRSLPAMYERAAALVISLWLAVAGTMLVIGIIVRLYVRYPLFALPAIALGSGVALTWLVRRSWWGVCIAAVLLTFSGITTLLMWYDRIVYASKVIK